MFAVKSEYSIRTPDGNDIPFYVADDSIFFAITDLNSDIKTEVFPAYFFRSFKNYALRFISLDNLKSGVLNYTAQCFYKNEAFWVHFVCHNDTKKIIAEVRDAQHFCKEYFKLDLPGDWSRLKIDAIIANLPVKATEWIEKCHDSLRILATNYEQHKAARRVYDEAWKILKIRKKDDARPTVREVLNKYGLTCDDLIQAVLEAYKSKFDIQYSELESELARLFK